MNSLLLKSSLALTSIAGVSGIGYSIYSSIPSKTKIKSYADELNGTLLSTENNENQTNWTARLTSLKNAKEGTLVNDLDLIKKKGTSANIQDLINWCKDNVRKEIQNKDNKEFNNIQSYCTFSVKEKINNAISQEENEDSEKWKKGYDILKSINNENELDIDLKSVKSKNETEGKKAIKAWCTKTYQIPYKGDEDQNFINAKKLCIDATG